ncbi:MAG: type II toxin-antitoxin system HicB family antitoxin [Desulfovibrio sp.]|jgi:predicted HicB family RNase H-like nuclease|nr:type II toxin-antitoxin system HicB family antitoxin [Desulfovibrio sp.]
MKNVMKFPENYQAVIMYDPDIDMLRGEFVGLNGGADFYAKDLEGLKKEGEISLRVFLEECAARGVAPRRPKGNFALRLDADTYQAASVAATAKGQSLNQFIAEAVQNEVEAGV